MTDFNTSMMREVFRWLSKYETVSAEYDDEWWQGFVSDGAEIHSKYPGILTQNIVFAIIDAQSETHKQARLTAELAAYRKEAAEGQQLTMDTSYNPEGGIAT